MNKLKKFLVGCMCSLTLGSVAPVVNAAPSFDELMTKWESTLDSTSQVTFDGKADVTIPTEISVSNSTNVSLGLKGAFDFKDIEMWLSGNVLIDSFNITGGAIVKDDVFYVNASMLTGQEGWTAYPLDEADTVGSTPFNFDELKTAMKELNNTDDSEFSKFSRELLAKYFWIIDEGDTVKVLLDKDVDPKQAYADYQVLVDSFLKEVEAKSAESGEDVDIDRLKSELDEIYTEEAFVKFFSQNPTFVLIFNADGRLLSVELSASADAESLNLKFDFDYESSVEVDAPEVVTEVADDAE